MTDTKVTLICIMAVCLAALLLILMGSYICFRLAYLVPKVGPGYLEGYLPETKRHSKYREQILSATKAASEIPYEDVWIQSRDGLMLRGKYYHVADDAAVCILIHGYRSIPEFDFSIPLPHLLKAGCNVLLIDQRAHGQSQGKCLTFGIKERYDCLDWVEYVKGRFGDETDIYLFGMSMGAASVLMASDMLQPEAVKGIIADCGYSDPSAIIAKTAKDHGLPVRISLFLTRLGGRLFGGFDINEKTAPEALFRCSIPVLFIHGTADSIVPYAMGLENYEACASELKKLVTVPDADHAISYFEDQDLYVSELDGFMCGIDL